MKRFLLIIPAIVLVLGCATYSPPGASSPHTAEDASRRYHASLPDLVEACQQAIRDVGADYVEQKSKIKEESATLIGICGTRLYGVLLLGDNGYTDVMLMLEDRSAREVIQRSVFQEFWAAVEKNLWRNQF
jgi:hypothetical protein